MDTRRGRREAQKIILIRNGQIKVRPSIYGILQVNPEKQATGLHDNQGEAQHLSCALTYGMLTNRILLANWLPERGFFSAVKSQWQIFLLSS